jgi:UDP-glucose 4-epimerase
MKILVAGGAGYIGSHTCKALSLAGHVPIVLDNLCQGQRDFVRWGELIVGDISDGNLLDHIFQERRIEAVIHFASFAYVGESVVEPDKYYRNNVCATLCLLDAMIRNKVSKIVFSSSCATYGIPQRVPIQEKDIQNPINPYGNTKLIVEKILADYDTAYNLKSICLRYFNAAGSDPDGQIGEMHNPEPHVIPCMLKAASGETHSFSIYGDDYDTPDGTCIRDYVHVVDLADAHVAALNLIEDTHSSDSFNLGIGNGYSVRRILDIVHEITKSSFSVEIKTRRPGDPPVLIANGEKARVELGWTPKYSIEAIIQTAWDWHIRKSNRKNLVFH